MCGINGFNFVDRKLIEDMNNSIKHRGPDAGGNYLSKTVSLGHRRLAILDLSENGAQPMSYSHKGKKVTIVFNGEIYNFQEIREDLKSKGYHFKSACDTEVILASYLEWGENCVNKFNGMWAFCIYDPKKSILFLSRDKVGKKPLHYFFDGKRFIFSSEIKSILNHKIEKKISKEAIDYYLSLGFIPAPHTIYNNIKKLDARQNIVFDIKKRTLKLNYYYDWPNYAPENNKKKLIKEGKELIADSVKKRLISDVSLGAFLSGGLDSSTVVCEMAKTIKNDNLNTYSIGFEGKFDETEYINLVKDRLKTKHHHKYFQEKDFESILKDAFYYYDEPFSDPSMFPSLFLTKFTREGLTVSLSGDGGDEVFGGYPRYNVAEQLEFLQIFPRWIRRLLILITPKKLSQGLKLSLKDKERFYEAREDYYRPTHVEQRLRDTMKICLKKTKGNLQEAVRLMDIYLYTLPDNFLLKVDRASMANALEVRCPLLDSRLVEYSMRIPSRWKCGLFKNKKLMKEIVKDLVPSEIIKRKKKGFTPPINEWIKKPEYSKEINEALKILNKGGIIDKNWKEFYGKKIMKETNIISNNYKIRLFLLYRWYKYWEAKNNY